jgi:hypothetical protein
LLLSSVAKQLFDAEGKRGVAGSASLPVYSIYGNTAFTAIP